MKVKNVLAAAVFSAVSSMSVATVSPAFIVDAYANSTTGGAGVTTLSLLAGQQFFVTVAATDLWNAGALPRWSNADGLTGNLFYTSGTDNQVPVEYPDGTRIGSYFGEYTQNGLTAPYGSLVGQIDNGSFFQIGTNYAGTAGSAGILKLYYFDSNNGDNTGSISAHVTAVPEPETFAMLLAGLGLVAGIARKRKPG